MKKKKDLEMDARLWDMTVNVYFYYRSCVIITYNPSVVGK